MPAYVIVLREEPVRDEAEMAEYRRKSRERMGEQAFALKPLAVYGALAALEGEAPDGVVMLEFPTLEEAQAWYDSPAYQAAVPHRLKAAKHRAFIVEGIPG